MSTKGRVCWSVDIALGPSFGAAAAPLAPFFDSLRTKNRKLWGYLRHSARLVKFGNKAQVKALYARGRRAFVTVLKWCTERRARSLRGLVSSCVILLTKCTALRFLLAFTLLLSGVLSTILQIFCSRAASSWRIVARRGVLWCCTMVHQLELPCGQAWARFCSCGGASRQTLSLRAW